MAQNQAKIQVMYETGTENLSLYNVNGRKTNVVVSAHAQ